MDPVVAWTFAVLLALAPFRASPHDRPLTWQRYAPDASREAYDERMKSIAEDATAVVREHEPLPGLSRANTLRLVLSVAFFESGFQRDVDFGTGKFGRGDFGRSWCLMQIQVGKGTVGQLVRTIPEDMRDWKGLDLVSDRRKCFRAGLEMMRRSMAGCPRAGLSIYASGKCDPDETKGRARMRFAWGSVLGRSFPKDGFSSSPEKNACIARATTPSELAACHGVGR